jgi:hypothetical protein
VRKHVDSEASRALTISLRLDGPLQPALPSRTFAREERT